MAWQDTIQLNVKPQEDLTHVIAQVDYDNAIQELREDNNEVRTPFRIK